MYVCYWKDQLATVSIATFTFVLIWMEENRLTLPAVSRWPSPVGNHLLRFPKLRLDRRMDPDVLMVQDANMVNSMSDKAWPYQRSRTNMVNSMSDKAWPYQRSRTNMVNSMSDCLPGIHMSSTHLKT